MADRLRICFNLFRVSFSFERRVGVVGDGSGRVRIFSVSVESRAIFLFSFSILVCVF